MFKEISNTVKKCLLYSSEVYAIDEHFTLIRVPLCRKSFHHVTLDARPVPKDFEPSFCDFFQPIFSTKG
jgi:hypothetical protein